MRLTALASVLLLACSSSDPPGDAGAGDTGARLDTAPSDSGLPDTSSRDTGALLDTSSPPDTAVALDAPLDTAPADVPRDTDPRASEVCRGVTAECDGRVVNVQIGARQSDGRTLHCGGCGITCQVGESCDLCVCAR